MKLTEVLADKYIGLQEITKEEATKFLEKIGSIEADYLVGDSTARNRVSRNTENYYTVLIDNLPEWQKFPKRSKSLICTNLLVKAKMYGNNWQFSYKIIPFDEVKKIAVCPEEDIWQSFPKIKGEGIKNMPIFNNMLTEIFAKIGISNLGSIALNNADSYQVLTDALRQIKKLPKNFINSLDNSYQPLAKILHQTKDPVKLIENLFNPEDNGFDLIDYNQLDNIPINKELWLSGKFIAIKSQ